jgi:hypothetical protein
MASVGKKRTPNEIFGDSVAKIRSVGYFIERSFTQYFPTSKESLGTTKNTSKTKECFAIATTRVCDLGQLTIN